MKSNSFTILVIFFMLLAVSVMAQSPALVQRFSHHELKIADVPGGPMGPWGVVVNKDFIYLYDRCGGKVIRLDRKYKTSKNFAVPAWCSAFAVDSNMRLAFFKNDKLYILNNGKEFKKVLEIKSDFPFIRDLFFDRKNNLYLVDDSQRSYPAYMVCGRWRVDRTIYYEGIPINGGFAYVKRVDRKTATFAFHSKSGAIVLKSLITSNTPLEAVRVIGCSGKGNIYVMLYTEENSLSVMIHRCVVVLNSKGEEIVRFTVPDVFSSYVRSPFAVFENGDFYGLFSLKDGFSLYRIDWETISECAKKKLKWPAELRSEKIPANYCMPDFETRLQEASGNETGSIYRDECITTAIRYTREEWDASECNVGNDYCQSSVQTPPWVTVGHHKKIPYKWGGWDTIDSFHLGLRNCYKAGDIDTSGVGNCSVGVDCSGFVSRCWHTPYRYETSTVHNISSVIGLDEMKGGDAFNYPGYHIILLERRNEDGSCTCIEARGGTWCVEETYKNAPPSGYTPRRYNGMLEGHKSGEGTLDNPFVVEALPYEDSYDLKEQPQSIWYDYSCFPNHHEDGPEAVYKVYVPCRGDLSVNVASGTGSVLDCFVLSSESPEACIAGGSGSLTVYGLSVGNYFVVIDSKDYNSSGPYTIDITLSSDDGMGNRENPFVIKTFPFHHEYSTNYSDMSDFDYYSCAPEIGEMGPEILYKLTTTVEGTLFASVSDGYGVDIDLHFLSELSSGACMARGDSTINVPNLTPGTYWLVADSWSAANGSIYPGDYKLDVNFVPLDTDGDGIPDSIDPEPDVIHGDVNGDGLIDLIDSQLLSDYLAGNIIYEQNGFDHPLCADLDLDGVLCIKDLVLYMNYFAGNVTLPFK